MSLYKELKNAGIPLDHHESDLYAKVTPISRDIIKRSSHSVTVFKSQIDGELWFDLPFAYEPFWENKPR